MGLFGVIGGVLSGLGLFRSGSGVGRAAKSLAADTGKTLAALREDVREIKQHWLEKAWPRVNDTLTDVQALVIETQTFVSTGTFTVKVLALLLIVCVLFSRSRSLLWSGVGTATGSLQLVGALGL